MDYRAVAELIAAIEAEDFPVRLTEWMKQHVAFDMVSILVHRGRSAPVHIYDNFNSKQANKGMERYLAETYLLNPFYQHHLKGVPLGIYRIRDLAHDTLLNELHHQSYAIAIADEEELGYVTTNWPRGLEEVDIALPLNNNETGEIAVYKSVQDGGVDDETIGQLRVMLPLISVLFQRYWSHVRSRQPLENAGSANWTSKAMDSFGAERMTTREREVIVMVLKGYSSESIAALLDISRATVKTHRKNAYEKLNISTQAELLSAFLDHVRRLSPAS